MFSTKEVLGSLYAQLKGSDGLSLQNDQDLWTLHLPPAGTGSKDPHVKASKVILRISEVKLHVVGKS